MLVTLAEQRNDTIPVGGGSLKVDAAHYVTSRNGGRKMLRRGHVDYHGGSAGVDSRLAARWLLPTSHNSCGLGNSQRHLRLSSRDSEEVNTVNGTYMSAVPYEAHWPAAGVCWQLPALSQHDGQQVVWGPPLATSTTTTGSLLWQYLQPALLPWPYMVLDPHNHHALIYPCASHYHHHHQPSYGAVHSSGSGPFVSSGIAYNGRVPRCATTIVPSLSDDEYEEKTDACSYGHMYTPDNGPDDGCNSVALEAPVDDEDNIFLRGLMTILASMMEIGDEMERQRLLDHRPVSHAEFTGTYTPCISVWNYLQRLSKFFHCSSECFVLALVYLDRAVKATAATTVPLYVTSYNVHRLFLTSLVLAVKFNDDFYYSNRRYAEVGCLTSTAELNGLEAIMLKLVGVAPPPPSTVACFRNMSATAFVPSRPWINSNDGEKFFQTGHRQTASRASSRRLRRHSTMIAAEANFNRRERPEGAMAACCSIPSSSYASHSDRRIRASTRAKAYVSRAVLSVTTSPESTDASGPSTKASTQPWPSPSTGISSDDSASSQTEGCCPRSSHDATDCADGLLPREVPDRTDIDCFLPSLSKVLDHLIVLGEEREKTMRRKPARSRFHSVTVPMKESSYSASLADAEEEKESSPFNITRLNVHRLLLTALTLAAKYYDDCYYANKRYAEVGGVSTRELNTLEASFLDMIPPEEYVAYKEQVENVSRPLPGEASYGE